MDEKTCGMNYEAEYERLSEQLCKTQMKLHETLDDMRNLDNKIAFLEGMVAAFKFTISGGEVDETN